MGSPELITLPPEALPRSRSLLASQASAAASSGPPSFRQRFALPPLGTPVRPLGPHRASDTGGGRTTSLLRAPTWLDPRTSDTGRDMGRMGLPRNPVEALGAAFRLEPRISDMGRSSPLLRTPTEALVVDASGGGQAAPQLGAPGTSSPSLRASTSSGRRDLVSDFQAALRSSRTRTSVTGLVDGGGGGGGGGSGSGGLAGSGGGGLAAVSEAAQVVQVASLGGLGAAPTVRPILAPMPSGRLGGGGGGGPGSGRSPMPPGLGHATPGGLSAAGATLMRLPSRPDGGSNPPAVAPLGLGSLPPVGSSRALHSSLGAAAGGGRKMRASEAGFGQPPGSAPGTLLAKKARQSEPANAGGDVRPASPAARDGDRGSRQRQAW